MPSDLLGAAAVRRIDQAKEFEVAPVYLAGEDRSGAARVLFPFRDDLGWSASSTGIANVVLDSPCRRARIGYLPTHPLYRSLWVIRVALAPLHPFQWTAVFSHGTPSEVVAGFAEGLAYSLVGGSQDALRPERDFNRVLSPLSRAGWQRALESEAEEVGADAHRGGSDLVYDAPDGLARARWLGRSGLEDEEQDLVLRAGWVFSAGLTDAGWRAAFAPEVPDHLVAAVSRRLASVQPVFRDERELVPELRDHLIISPAFADDGSAAGQQDGTRRRRKPGDGG